MSYIKVEMLSLDDFDQICRTCSSKYKLKSLYENIETLSMLESFTQMQFSKSDELPDKICAECLTKIHECYHFINNCKIIDEELRKCLSKNLKQLEIKTNELHSSIDIEDDEPLESGEIEKYKIESEPEDEAVEVEVEAKPEPQSQPDKNIKDVNVKQSEYYILKWGSPSETEDNGKFEFTPVNNSSNKQDLVEQEALRRLQAMNKMKRLRTRFLRPVDETRTIDFEKKIPTYSLIGMDDIQEKKSDDETIEEQMNAVINQTNAGINQTKAGINQTKAVINQTKTTVDQPTNTDESHRPRAKLTLPHSEHTTFLRRNNDTPERIALRRALAREQMRKYRSKLTAEETAEHRAAASENMRKYLVKVRHVELNRGGRRAPNETEKSRAIDSPQIPLRLSEMAQTLLQSKGSLKTKEPRVEYSRDARNAGEMSRFSLRPTKIPQVKRECYEARLRVEQQQMTKFRSWKRKIETPEEVTIRLAKNALQMKRLCSSMSMREPGQIEESVLRRSKNAGHLIEESALRRAKAAGQIRQYRPMLRKNKNTNEPHIHTGK